MVSRDEGQDPIDGHFRNVIVVECEVCERRVVLDASSNDREEHAKTAADARAHWEREASVADGAAGFAFFALPGVGDLKAKVFGSWADVLLRVPYLMNPGDPVLPRHVVDAVLRSGASHAGMSGGCEWPRRDLSDWEHVDLRKGLAARGLLDVEAPSWVRTPEDYQDWRFSLRWGCTADASRAWRGELSRSDATDDERRALWDPQAWTQAFDEGRSPPRS